MKLCAAKPAAWAGKDAPCLAAAVALMAQRPSARPREDALLEAERLRHRVSLITSMRRSTACAARSGSTTAGPL